MSYSHFSTYERAKIEELKNLGYTIRAIAKRLARHHSSVARELKRAVCGRDYDAQAANCDYQNKRKNSKPVGKWNESLCSRVKEKLLATWSPEQISHTATKGELSHKTIYNWLYSGRIEGVTLSALRRKGRKRSCKNLAHYARGTSIRERPKEVYSRGKFGHWELDTVVSGKEKGHCLATFVERKTRFYTALKMPDRTAASMENAIKCLHGQLPRRAFLSGTSDRGGEFACYDNIQRDLGLPLYFADPYCPHQRGSNEYSNGLLREFYPKGTGFAKISQQEIDCKLFLINNRPRKCLGWRSPFQSFLHELSHLA